VQSCMARYLAAAGNNIAKTHPPLQWRGSVTLTIHTQTLNGPFSRTTQVSRYTHTPPFNGPFSGTRQVSRYRKGKTNLDFTEAETLSGSGISWAICKSAPCSRQTTTPAPDHSVFLQAGCPSYRPTNSIKVLKESWYQKGKTNRDFTEARDTEWQWHGLGRVQVCSSLQTDNHASTPPLSFLQARCPSCHPTNSVKALTI